MVFKQPEHARLPYSKIPNLPPKNGRGPLSQFFSSLLARKMHRSGRISCKVLIFRGIKFATQISAAFAEPHRP